MKHFRRWTALLLALLLLCPAAALAQKAVQFAVDFDYLRHFAPNVVGWLYQPGTTIDRPVVCTDSGYFYLTHGFDQRRLASGSVYMLSQQPPDLADAVIVLRGRNNTDNSLFGSLSEYRDAAYYREHPTMYLVAPEGNYQLDIFAGVKTRHKDEESWLVTEHETQTPERLQAILEQSFLKPDPAYLPEPGDGWAILTTEDAKSEGSRFVIYARKRPMPASDAPVVYMNQQGMDARASVSGYVSAGLDGTWMSYGQNDPLWDRMVFEIPSSSRRRPFGDGGCGPTSVAMAIANLVPREDLPKLRSYASSDLGYVFCPCCIGSNWCDVGHVPYQLNTPDEFLRYFPIAVADFALGNNVFGVRGRRDSFGTNMSYLESICSVYDISITGTKDLGEMVRWLQRENTAAIVCTSGKYSPFTNSSHFLAIVHATDSYVYVLDPLRRKNYAGLDHNGIVEVVTPGLVRVSLDNISQCCFYTIQLLEYTPES